MLSIDVRHPDTPYFTTIKQDLTKVTGANVSVKLNKEFIAAAKNNEDYILTYPVDFNRNDLDYIDLETYEYNVLYEEVNSHTDQIIYLKKVKAKELWKQIIKCAWSTGEPGIFNWDFVMDYDPTSVYPELKAISTNPCQPEWATILTKNGIKQFKDINIGDEIWSIQGWTKIINKQFTGIKEVYEFRTTAGCFYGTENHNLISKGEKIQAKDCQKVDILAGGFHTPQIVDFYIPYIMDGLVLGDGSIHEASNNLIFLCIGENDQDYFNSEIKNLILKHREKLKPTAYEIQTNIYHYELPLTFNRVIPDRYMFENDSVKVCSFLRGLYSANGSVIDKRITFKTTSSKLRDQLQILLSAVGIRSYYTTNKSKDVLFSNGSYTCKESYDINISTDRELFYHQIGFIQNYKMDKLKLTLDGKYKSGVKSHDIISQSLISEESVYSITVDNSTHTYWTGGLNVSNCGELPLGAYDSCRLIASNLFSLVVNPFSSRSYIDWELAYKVFYETQILADIFVDLEIEAVDRILTKIQPEYSKVIDRIHIDSPELSYEWLKGQSDEFKLWWKIRETGQNGRRTGTGITGYADMLAAIGKNYGDEEITEEIFKLKLQAELDASIDLAILNSAFPLWDKNKEFKSITSDYRDIVEDNGKPLNSWYEFIYNTFPEQWDKMRKYGRRNAGLLNVGSLK